jgi:hypothetical protein
MMYLIPWFSYALPVLAELSFSTLAQLGHLGTRSWIKMIKVCNICKRIWIYIYGIILLYMDGSCPIIDYDSDQGFWLEENLFILGFNLAA